MFKFWIYLLVILASFSLYSQQEKVEQAIASAYNAEELTKPQRHIVTNILFSYLDEPTEEKEKQLKDYLKFEEKLESSPLSGVKDGIVDHMRRITQGMGIVGDFAEPALELIQSLENGIVEVINNGVAEVGVENIQAKDLANIADIAGKIILYQVDSHAQSQPGTVITVSGSNKQDLLEYLFSLDLLKLSESTNSDLYELTLLKTLTAYGKVSRQIQGLKYSLYGTAALVEWSYLISDKHRNLKNTGRYFDQVKLLIKKNKRNNPFKKEWKNSLTWMRRTLRRKQKRIKMRPLATILSSGVLVAEIKLSLLYAKINTYIVSSRVLGENSSVTYRLFNKYVIIPAMQRLMRAPSWMLGGAFKTVHKLLNIGDDLISKTHRALKPQYDFCRYQFRSWFEVFRKNIY